MLLELRHEPAQAREAPAKGLDPVGTARNFGDLVRGRWLIGGDALPATPPAAGAHAKMTLRHFAIGPLTHDVRTCRDDQVHVISHDVPGGQVDCHRPLKIGNTVFDPGPAMLEPLTAKHGFSDATTDAVIRPDRFVIDDASSWCRHVWLPSVLTPLDARVAIAKAPSGKSGENSWSVGVLDLPPNMLERTRDMLTSFCDQVVISGSSHGVVGHQMIKDLRTDTGPLAAIEATLASGISPQYLIVPCDLPLLPAGLLARLLVGDNNGLSCFDAPTDQGFRTRSLPCRIGAACLPEVVDMLGAGERAVHRLVERLGPLATRVSLAAREVDLLINVNTPDDYSRACRLLNSDSG
jgi:molybdopterin-guanine dinucleotide biosynthesis protein A